MRVSKHGAASSFETRRKRGAPQDEAGRALRVKEVLDPRLRGDDRRRHNGKSRVPAFQAGPETSSLPP